MKKALVLLALLSVNAVAQEVQPVADLKMTRTEVMEWENIQLKGEQVNAKIAQLREMMKQLEAQLADLNKRVLDSRKLSAAEFTPNFQATPPMVVKVQPKEAAKK